MINSIEFSSQREIGNQPDESKPSNAVLDVEPRDVETQFEMTSTQEYSSTSDSINNSVANILSTRESSSDLPLGEQYEDTNATVDVTATIAKDSFVIIAASDEDDSAAAVPNSQSIPSTDEVLNHYPHIVIKLCDGEIINAESGERIINLSQFMVAHNLDVINPMELDHPRQQ